MRAFIALLDHQDYDAAIELATGALYALGKDQPHWRVLALWAMAESQERTRDITQAIATFRQAAHTGRALGNQIFAIVAEMSLAKALNDYGRRVEAVAVCERAIGRYTDDTGRVSPVVGLILSRLGMLRYEANQLELARRHVEEGLALSEQLAIGGSLVFSLGTSAQILHAQGESNAALEALGEASRLAVQTGVTEAAWPLALEADIRLAEGDLSFARRWAETADLSPDDTPQLLRLEQHLVYGRLLLAEGRLSDARRWLACLERFAHGRSLHRWSITIHILQAVAARKSGDHPAARELLARAIAIAAPEDYYRAFLGQDGGVSALLSKVRHVAPRFVDRLLGYTGTSVHREAPLTQSLVEPLSEREIEVLRLIASGLANREISTELYIAVGTVKRHINHIYGKLGVHSRTQAIAKARELQLLD